MELNTSNKQQHLYVCLSKIATILV